MVLEDYGSGCATHYDHCFVCGFVFCNRIFVRFLIYGYLRLLLHTTNVNRETTT